MQPHFINCNSYQCYTDIELIASAGLGAAQSDCAPHSDGRQLSSEAGIIESRSHRRIITAPGSFTQTKQCSMIE